MFRVQKIFAKKYYFPIPDQMGLQRFGSSSGSVKNQNPKDR